MNILIAEDDPVTRRALEEILKRWGYTVIAVEDGIRARDVLLQSDGPRMAILDWMLPGLDGPTICRELRRYLRDSFLFMMLLTSRDQKEDLINGLESGADEYLTKPFNVYELRARLSSGRRMLEMHEKLEAAHQKLQHWAAHDSLTSLWNRGSILKIMENELARTGREQFSLGIVLGDVDYFKLINDTYGHLVGDDILREVCKRMSGSIRPYDSLGRYGGEEFLIVLPGCDSTSAGSIAERIRKAVGSRPFEARSCTIDVSISMGVTSAAPTLVQNADILLQIADEALYEAKQSGRNQVVVNSPPAINGHK